MLTQKGSGGCGQVVSMLAFYSDDPSSNPAEAYSFFCKICIWKDRKQTKESVVGPIKKRQVPAYSLMI